VECKFRFCGSAWAKERKWDGWRGRAEAVEAGAEVRLKEEEGSELNV